MISSMLSMEQIRLTLFILTTNLNPTLLEIHLQVDKSHHPQNIIIHMKKTELVGGHHHQQLHNINTFSLFISLSPLFFLFLL
jgi:hypothetical protein